MDPQYFLKLLGFNEMWLRLGFLTENELIILGHEYEGSDDKNTEHYRWRVFQKYRRSHRPLSPDMAENLYDLGIIDPDPVLGEAIMHEIVSLPECPDTVLEKASASGKAHLIKAVERNRLLKELDSGLTDDLFARYLASRDSYLQRKLLVRAELSLAQLEQLAVYGSNRAVRNMAQERLRRRK